MASNELIPPSPTEIEYRDSQMSSLGDDVDEIDDLLEPFHLFAKWLELARKSELNDPNAMALATADTDGMPDVRMVLLKDLDDSGFVFYTNLQSSKGNQLRENPQAALCFHWKSLRRQIRIRGLISPVSNEEADTYFASRARDSKIGAWSSAQSRPLEDRFALEKSVAAYALKFGVGNVPRPDFWSGFRLTPLRIEFWRDKPFRLHDRQVFERLQVDAPWAKSKLYP